MDFKKIIKFFYVIYTMYILMAINVTTLELWTMIPAIILMWLIYILFSIGNRINKGNKSEKYDIINIPSKLLNAKKYKLIILVLISGIFSILAIEYYTGQTPMTVINNLLSDTSVYYEYQKHFAEQQISTFSLKKLPYIFMFFYVKIIVFYSLISYFLLKKEVCKKDWLYIIGIIIPFLYIGIARGTNFEFFELVMMIVFIILSKNKIGNNFKEILKIVFIIGIMIFIFYTGIAARGMEFDFRISRDIQYNPTSIIATVSNLITFIIIVIFDYFGFGFFYISTYITKVWWISGSSFIAGLIPKGNILLNGESVQDQVGNIIDMGARWHPDTALAINNIGLIGLLMLCFFLGFFVNYISKIKKRNFMVYLTAFIIFIQMASYPIGNFIAVSSANKLITALIIVYWIWKIFYNKKIIIR